jgi:flagellar hook assembly protein FlgD
VKSAPVLTNGAAAPILASAYPNPFNPETAISYTVKNSGPVTLRIYSTDGRLVRTLKQSEATVAGTHEVTWNGTDDHGRHVSSGIYFVKTSQKAGASEETSVLKLALTK